GVDTILVVDDHLDELASVRLLHIERIEFEAGRYDDIGDDRLEPADEFCCHRVRSLVRLSIPACPRSLHHPADMMPCRWRGRHSASDQVYRSALSRCVTHEPGRMSDCAIRLRIRSALRQACTAAPGPDRSSGNTRGHCVTDRL